VDPLTLLLASLLFTLMGVSAGIITGLIPGLHVNNWAAIVVASQGALAGLVIFIFGWTFPSPEEVAIIVSCLIVGNAISHTFLDFIPSIFLGAPEAETALSVLPGHRMLLKGRGYEAVKLSAYGSLMAVFLALALVLPFRMIMGSPGYVYEKLKPVIYCILLLVAALLILTEGSETLHIGKKPVLKCAGREGVTREVGEDEDLVPKLSVAEARERIGEPLSVVGRSVSRFGSRRVEIEDETGTLEVWFERPFEFPLGELVKVYGIMEEKGWFASSLQPKLWALLIFLLSGTLGYVLLGFPGILTGNIYLLPRPSLGGSSVILFPLFTGLFGLSTLILSATTKPSIPAQIVDERPLDLPGWRRARAVSSSVLAGTFVGVFPGVSGASATIIAKLVAGGEPGHDAGREESEKEFIVALGGVNTATAIIAVTALFVIMRARSGAAVAIQSLSATYIHPWEPLWNVPFALTVMLFSILLASLAGYWLTINLGRLFAQNFNRIPYLMIVKAVILFLILMVIVLTGLLGLLVVIVSTAVGLLPPLVGVKRVHLMGCLILPIVLFLV